MPELGLLGAEIRACQPGGCNLERQRGRHRETVAFEPHELARVVGQQPHAPHTEFAQDLGADPVVPLVRLEPELLVGLDGVIALVLELVGPDLVRQTDAAAFLVQIQEDTPALCRNSLHGRGQLAATVAPGRMEHLAGQTA